MHCLSMSAFFCNTLEHKTYNHFKSFYNSIYLYYTLINMTETTIRGILDQHGRLTSSTSIINADDDLFNFGLTSLSTVGLMMALEDEFDIEFTDEMLDRKTFHSINSIKEAVEALLA